MTGLSVVSPASNGVSPPAPFPAPAEEDRGVSVQELYRIFFFRAFKGPPAVWKFTRSFIHALVRPASLNPAVDCGPGRRYLSALHLAQSVFSIAVASSVVNLSVEVDAAGHPTGERVPSWFSGPFESAYLLWVFGMVLIASLLLQRLWVRFTNAQILPARQLGALFVYEVCVLLVPLLGILVVLQPFQAVNRREPLSAGSWIALWIYAGAAVAHLFVFLFRLGGRAQLSFLRRLLIAPVLAYIFLVVMLPAMIMALPFLFLPVLLALYPVHALLRDHLPKKSGLKRFVDRMQRRLETEPE